MFKELAEILFGKQEVGIDETDEALKELEPPKPPIEGKHLPTFEERRVETKARIAKALTALLIMSFESLTS